MVLDLSVAGVLLSFVTRRPGWTWAALSSDPRDARQTSSPPQGIATITPISSLSTRKAPTG